MPGRRLGALLLPGARRTIRIILTPEEIARCDEFARARAAAWADIRPDSRFNFKGDKDARILSVRGEAAFEKLTGLPMDWTISPRQGGPDFTAGRLTIDIKTAVYYLTPGLTVQPWKKDPPHRCDAYVHCSLGQTDPEAGWLREMTMRDWNVVKIEGFAWAEDVFQPARMIRGNKEKQTTDHYLVRTAELLDITELLAYTGLAPAEEGE